MESEDAVWIRCVRASTRLRDRYGRSVLGNDLVSRDEERQQQKDDGGGKHGSSLLVCDGLRV